jgi:mono/diheme cytochrome c family protein
VLAFAGCGGGGTQPAVAPTLANGEPSGHPKAVFVSVCGSCHTLADAGTHGKAGPNLDELQPAAHDVQLAIELGKGAMPAQ